LENFTACSFEIAGFLSTAAANLYAPLTIRAEINKILYYANNAISFLYPINRIPA
jgi:hypothetical protein